MSEPDQDEPKHVVTLSSERAPWGGYDGPLVKLDGKTFRNLIGLELKLAVTEEPQLTLRVLGDGPLTDGDVDFNQFIVESICPNCRNHLFKPKTDTRTPDEQASGPLTPEKVRWMYARSRNTGNFLHNDPWDEQLWTDLGQTVRTLLAALGYKEYPSAAEVLDVSGS
jgi:hypothetical protein